MTNEDYRLQLNFISKVISLNEFQLFLTIRDLRKKPKYHAPYKDFRSTSSDGSGYAARLKYCKLLMDRFRRAYGLRGGKGQRKHFHYFGINESGVGRKHWLSENCSHLHVAIGWQKESRYFSNPRQHLDKFFSLLDDSLDLRWLDVCGSLHNQGKTYTIQDKKAVGVYMAKPELGHLEGKNFSKEPFWDGPLTLPTKKELLLEPLGMK